MTRLCAARGCPRPAHPDRTLCVHCTWLLGRVSRPRLTLRHPLPPAETPLRRTLSQQDLSTLDPHASDLHVHLSPAFGGVRARACEGARDPADQRRTPEKTRQGIHTKGGVNR